jgi:site-specific DNA recombinase
VNIAVIYARVSSREQRKRNTIESQLRELPALAERIGLKVVATYIDDGISGAALLERRQGLMGMLERIALGDVSHVLVFDLDRFTRHVRLDLRGRIFGAIQNSGVVIVEFSSGASYDLRTFEGRLTVQIRAELAADWLEKHRQRVKSGQATARARGWKPSGQTPFGLNFDKSSGFTENKDEKAVIEEIYQRIIAGMSFREICRSLNERNVPSTLRTTGHWSPANIWRLAHADWLVTGQWPHGGGSIEVPKLITPETWNAAQRELASKRHFVRQPVQKLYLAQGLGVCEVCGAKIRIQSSSPAWGRAYQYYSCANRVAPRHETKRCTLPNQRADEVDERLWAAVVALIGSRWHEYREGLLQAARAAISGHDELALALQSAKDEMSRLDSVESVLLARFGDGAISSAGLDVELGKLSQRRARAKQELEKAQGRLGHAGLDFGELDRAVDAVRDRLVDAPPRVRREVVLALIPGTGKHRVSFGPNQKLTAVVAVSALAFLAVSNPRHQGSEDVADGLALELVA